MMKKSLLVLPLVAALAACSTTGKVEVTEKAYHRLVDNVDVVYLNGDQARLGTKSVYKREDDTCYEVQKEVRYFNEDHVEIEVTKTMELEKTECAAYYSAYFDSFGDSPKPKEPAPILFLKDGSCVQNQFTFEPFDAESTVQAKVKSYEAKKVECPFLSTL